MKLFKRVKSAPLTDMPAHPSTVAWNGSPGNTRRASSKVCGDRVLWSTTSKGGYIEWEDFLKFIGEHGRSTLRLVTEELTK